MRGDEQAVDAVLPGCPPSDDRHGFGHEPMSACARPKPVPDRSARAQSDRNDAEKLIPIKSGEREREFSSGRRAIRRSGQPATGIVLRIRMRNHRYEPCDLGVAATVDDRRNVLFVNRSQLKPGRAHNAHRLRIAETMVGLHGAGGVDQAPTSSGDADTASDVPRPNAVVSRGGSVSGKARAFCGDVRGDALTGLSSQAGGSTR